MSSWTVKDLEEEKRIVLNELGEKESYLNVDNIVDSVLWKDDTLSLPILGNEDTIKNLTLKQLVEYKKKVFSKGNVALVVTGIITDETMTYCETKLSKVILSECSFLFQPKFSVKKTLDINLYECQWSYIDVNLAFVIPENINQYELTIFNSILGGGTGAKLQYILREEKGLTSDIFSYLEIHSDVSALHISFSTHKSKLYDCIEAIVVVLNDMKKGITNTDMQTNMPYFSENLWFWLENPETLNLELGWEVFNSIEPYSVEKRIEHFQKVTQARLSEVAQEVFRSKNISLAMAGSLQRFTKKRFKEILELLDK